MKRTKIWIGTSSKHKFLEAKGILSEYRIQLERLNIERVEIQSDDPKKIAEYSLRTLNVNIPILIEDAGLYIEKYFGFPGPYSSYALRTISNEGILKLMEGENNRKAKYISAVAYRDHKHTKTFMGEVQGRIAKAIKGTKGFGYDPIFIPDEGDNMTFGEMGTQEKAKISHRARAFKAFGNWFLSKL